MKITVSTAGIVRDAHLYDDLKMIRDAGFEGIDLNFAGICPHGGAIEEYEGSLFAKSQGEIRKHYREYAEICGESGLEIVQAHAPWPCYFKDDAAVNVFLHEAIEKCMAVISEIGCKYLVVHPYVSYEKDTGECIEANYRLYAGLADAAKKYNVIVCAENLFRYKAGRLLDEPFANAGFAGEFIDKLNKEAGKEIFGFCFDIGHANVLGKNIYDFFMTMGKRIKILHIHGNNGIGDQHMIPYTSVDYWGDNPTISWEDVTDGIADSGYNGDLNLELATGAVPRELLPAFLRYAADTDQYLRKRIRTGCDEKREERKDR